VAHTSLGIQVVHLYTGRMLTSLKLRSHALYEAVDKDHTIDQIWASVGHEAQHHKVGEFGDHSCSALIGSGVPNVRKLVANVGICFEGRWFKNAPLQDINKNTIQAVPPIVIRSSNANFFSAFDTINMHTIFLINTGTITCITDRKQTWQIETDLIWENQNTIEGMVPNIMSFKIEIGDEDENILAVAKKIMLISSSGNILAEHSLENLPTTYPVIGDINGDGINDVIVVSDGSYSIFLLQGTGESSIFSIIVGVLLLTILIIHVRKYQKNNTL